MIHSKVLKINTVEPELPQTSILLIYTGGTLGMVYGESGALEPFNFEQILDKIPSLKTLDLELSVISFSKLIDSSNVNPKDWKEIGNIIFENYNRYDGFVVLHGTDTMAYSASALSFMLSGLNKPVIFTGAQLPIGAVRSDARENLITAIEVASARKDGLPIVSEVCIYFDSYLLRGNRARKVQSIHFDAFESVNYPVLADAGVLMDYHQSALKKYGVDHNIEFKTNFDSSVVVLKLFPGISREVVKGILEIEGLKGVILETYGSGNAPTDQWFIDLMQDAVKRGIILLNVSQCNGGKVIQGRYGTSALLKKMGILSGSDMTTEAAVTKLMFLLGTENDPKKIREALIRPLAGELTE
ncbi:asparaginase [Xanthovirga aplysinae]|uniref:asparaginase n=1 Tax=Xanthovirga aplysinae TaxID=2529853 RepID=UPI0012BCBFED|nr:asparaginase [Xanthovirga aplysinae]MTI32788.1 asparaginase [Xanthovirga aplysinae]